MSNVMGRPNLYNRKKQPRLEVRLSEELKEEFQAVCKSKTSSVQEVLEKMVKNYIKENKKATGQ